MLLKKLISLLFISSSLCFISRPFAYENRIECIRRDVKREISVEDESIFDDATNKARDDLDFLVSLECINSDIDYINPIAGDSINIVEREDEEYYEDIMSNYYSSLPFQARQHFMMIAYQDDDVSNFEDILSTSFTCTSLKYGIDYYIDRMDVASIREVNGTYIDTPVFSGTPIIYNEGGQEHIPEDGSIDITRPYSVTSVLTTAMFNVGLSTYVISLIKGSLMNILKTIASLIPIFLKAIMIAACIVILTVVIVTNWKQIKIIFSLMVSLFVSSALSFAVKIASIFSDIEIQAKKSDADNKVMIKDEVIYLTAAREASDVPQDDKYYRAFIFDKTYEQGVITGLYDPNNSNKIYPYTEDVIKDLPYLDLINPLDRTEAINRLALGASNGFFHNTYTFISSNAYSIMQAAFPTYPIVLQVHSKPDSWQLPHYHADFGGLDNQSKSHSLFGIPTHIPGGDR